MEVLKLNPIDKKVAAKVFARAFFDYPMMTFIWPDPVRRRRYFDWFSECSIDYGLRYGEVYTTPDIAGISIWLPPTQPYITIWGTFRAGFFPLPLAMGVKHFVNRHIKNENATMKAHKEIVPEPHWYLFSITVDPSKQGKGIGSLLLQHGLKVADVQNLPCYLETHDERNIPFYQQHDFKMLRTELVPGSDLRFWCFRREPIHKISSTLNTK